MAERKINLCAQIPADLHARVTREKETSGKSLSEYMTELITNYYENMKGITTMDNMRTLAVQMDAELFDRLDAYLKKNKLKKRRFITDLIRKALDESDALVDTDTVPPHGDVSDNGSDDE